LVRFLFQAEDGIRDRNVTGVQTCALPISKPDTFNYSYNGACQPTESEEGYGELRYQLGHTGAAVVFGSGWGDGFYPVFAEKHNGRIMRVYVYTGADPIPEPD